MLLFEYSSLTNIVHQHSHITAMVDYMVGSASLPGLYLIFPRDWTGCGQSSSWSERKKRKESASQATCSWPNFYTTWGICIRQIDLTVHWRHHPQKGYKEDKWIHKKGGTVRCLKLPQDGKRQTVASGSLGGWCAGILSKRRQMKVRSWQHAPRLPPPGNWSTGTFVLFCSDQQRGSKEYTGKIRVDAGKKFVKGDCGLDSSHLRCNWQMSQNVHQNWFCLCLLGLGDLFFGQHSLHCINAYC